MVIGGMPEVVASYTKTNDFNEAFRVQKKIISDYQSDISKHAKGEEKTKVRACYDSIHKQLARELKRFQYSFVEKKQTSRKYGGSVKWLIDSELVNACYNVREPYIPLMANEIEGQFKMYINDTGLLTEMYGREAKIGILNNTIKGNARGAVYENVVAESLVKRGYTLHYYKPDDDHELEFLIEKDGTVVPIEVKAGNNPSASLNAFIKDFSPSVAYKLVSGNIGVAEKNDATLYGDVYLNFQKKPTIFIGLFIDVAYHAYGRSWTFHKFFFKNFSREPSRLYLCLVSFYVINKANCFRFTFAKKRKDY